MAQSQTLMRVFGSEAVSGLQAHIADEYGGNSQAFLDGLIARYAEHEQLDEGLKAVAYFAGHSALFETVTNHRQAEASFRCGEMISAHMLEVFYGARFADIILFHGGPDIDFEETLKKYSGEHISRVVGEFSVESATSFRPQVAEYAEAVDAIELGLTNPAVQTPNQNLMALGACYIAKHTLKGIEVDLAAFAEPTDHTALLDFELAALGGPAGSYE